MAIDYAYKCQGTDYYNGGQLRFTGTLAFGTNNWTIEAFVRFNSSMFGGAQRDTSLFGVWNTGSSTFLAATFNYPSTNDVSLNAAVLIGGSAATTGLTTYNFIPDRWYHIAYVRSGTALSLYVDGSRIATTTISGSITSAANWHVNGSENTGAISYADYYISNHRIVIGTALYTGTTYTVPTSTLTAISGTVLLTAVSPIIYDDGPNHLTFVNTATGTGSLVSVTNNGPFGDNVIVETLTLSDTTDATVGTLAQRFTNSGVLQIPGTFDEYSPSSGSNVYTDAIAVYPSTISATSGAGTLAYSGTAGTFTWTCPAGVTSVSVVCVGGGGTGGYNGGGGGGGAALAYINNYSVTPGTTYTVVAGFPSDYNGGSGGTSYFNNTSTVAAGGGYTGGNYASPVGGAGGTVLAGTGFAGGTGGNGQGTLESAGGGGAGGYTGTGGNGSTVNGPYPSLTYTSATSSTGGGGGGGAAGAAGGGGVGLYGLGSNGTAGNSLGVAGTGGSGGTSGGTGYATDVGGAYGGGGGGSSAAAGGAGAIRIVWNSLAATVFPTASSITWSDSRLTNGGNLFIKSSFDEYTLNPSRLTATSGTTVRKQTSSSYQVYDSIDEVSLAYTITPDKKIVNEGDTVTYTINAPLSRSGILYYTNTGSMAAADFSGGLVYGVTPLTWSGTATATLWSFTGLTQSATSGSGTGAVFSIRKNNATTTMATHGVLTVIPTSPGSGYQIGDTITIPGASLGLTTPTNNLTITVGSDWFAQGVYPSTVTGTGLGTMTTGAANWTCPDGVYRISVVCVGGGGSGDTAGPHGGGGGALSYVKDVAVVPGTVYPIQVGIGGVGGTSVAAGTNGAPTYWNDGTIVYASGGNAATNGGYGGIVGAGTGFAGGAGGWPASGSLGNGGGGAGGYTAAGGNGGVWSGNISQSGKNSLNGGGGGSTGGGAGILDSTGTVVNTSTGNGGGGGGVGLLGISNLGLGGVNLAGSTGAILGQGGYGGSGGSNGGNATSTVGGAGAIYGGGGGGGNPTGGAGGAGALRMIWNYPHGFLPSTIALTAVTNTKLLTAQSATITDVTGINTITNIATVTAGSTIIPFASTYSYQFNGTTQYLYVPHSQNFVFGSTDDFTIEGYLYTSATTINKGLIYKRSGSNISGVNFGTSTTTASRFHLRVANADGSAWTINDATAGTFAISTWYHFAITKTNGVIYLYINGLMVRQYAHTTAIYDDGSVLNIGQDPGGARWVGYLSNIRIIKGTALYYPPSTIVNRNYPDYPFVVDNKGSIPITNGTGTLALTVGQDILQEGVQDIQLQLRSDSTSGTILATAPTVLVADTSKPLALPGGGQCWCAYPDYVSGPNLVYTGTPGVFTFTAPKGYTAVSAVAIGAGGGGGPNGGGGGGGGALAYSASIAVTGGTTYTITCGAPGVYGGTPTAGGASSFASTIIANGGQPGGTNAAPAGGAGGTVGAGTGFAGGAGGAGIGTYAGGGGGGAGGYTVAGGAGGAVTGTVPTLTAGSGVASTSGGAGGSGGGSATAGLYYAVGGGGGGTSPFGSVAVASIAGTSYAGAGSSCGRGGGGSGGVATTTASGVQLGERGYTATPYPNGANQPPHGGRFGGGGGAGDGNNQPGGNGGPGCVRIIWGTGRAYPATLTADRVSGYPAAVGNPTGQQ